MKKIILILLVLINSIVYSQKQNFIVQGSEYQTFFKTMCVYDQYDYLIKYTSLQSLKKFGRDRIIQLYSDLKVEKKRNWEFVNVEIDGNKAKYYFMISLTGATTRTVYFDLIREDNKWKIVLPDNLDKFLK